jgi:adenine phosphoribosyltransferase
MDYYNLNICGLSRKLPIVAINPKIKIASFNLLGDGELVEKIADELIKKLKSFDFDYLVGPEVKVVPLLQSLAIKLKKPRFVILRKNIMGYMTNPLYSKNQNRLVLNGPDVELIKNNKVFIIDDVVSTGQTIQSLIETVNMTKAQVVGVASVLKQGEEPVTLKCPFIYLQKLPYFTS